MFEFLSRIIKAHQKNGPFNLATFISKKHTNWNEIEKDKFVLELKLQSILRTILLGEYYNELTVLKDANFLNDLFAYNGILLYLFNYY